MTTQELIARVLHRLQAGLTPTQIAAELHIARKTVRIVRAGKHPLQHLPRRQRCLGCGGLQMVEIECLVCRDRLAIARIGRFLGNSLRSD